MNVVMCLKEKTFLSIKNTKRSTFLPNYTHKGDEDDKSLKFTEKNKFPRQTSQNLKEKFL